MNSYDSGYLILAMWIYVDLIQFAAAGLGGLELALALETFELKKDVFSLIPSE